MESCGIVRMQSGMNSCGFKGGAVEFSIVPTPIDVEVYFRTHPEALVELRLITLARMYSEMVEAHSICPKKDEEKDG